MLKEAKKELWGKTSKTFDEVFKYANELRKKTFETYDPINRNCCHFANYISLFLCGNPIHDHLLNQEIPLVAVATLGVAVLLSSFGNR